MSALLLLAQVEPKQALLKAIAHAMAERAAQCNPQEISNCVWAFARLSGLPPLCSGQEIPPFVGCPSAPACIGFLGWHMLEAMTDTATPIFILTLKYTESTHGVGY